MFNDEADNLEKARYYKSDHLIKPIAAYERGQDRCLVFPWATGGNLSKYWETQQSDATEKDGVYWILSQFVGLCSALEELHENNCRHGDLKPENILWFRELDDGVRTGTLQIADLNLTTFHEKEAYTKERRQRGIFTNTPSGTFRYEPPEMDSTRGYEQVRSRGYDIWSMGCILLELLVWLVYGYDFLTRFQDITRCFWLKQRGDDGKPSYVVADYVSGVMDTMASRLAEQPHQGQLYLDLLDIIQNRLLVVECSEVYESSPDKREIARVLHKLIRQIYERCSAVPNYLTPVRLDEILLPFA